MIRRTLAVIALLLASGCGTPRLEFHGGRFEKLEFESGDPLVLGGDDYGVDLDGYKNGDAGTV